MVNALYKNLNTLYYKDLKDDDDITINELSLYSVKYYDFIPLLTLIDIELLSKELSEILCISENIIIESILSILNNNIFRSYLKENISIITFIDLIKLYLAPIINPINTIDINKDDLLELLSHVNITMYLRYVLSDKRCILSIINILEKENNILVNDINNIKENINTIFFYDVNTKTKVYKTLSILETLLNYNYRIDQDEIKE